MVLVMAIALALGLSPARAGGPQTARVTKVPDGDTIDVDFDGDRTTDARVRLIGIDTPELGRCGSAGAKLALRRLLQGKTVELVADRAKTGTKGRLMRRVIFTGKNGPVDATTWMLERGWGPWMPRTGETTNNLEHHEAAASAAAAGRRYFDPDRCRVGPKQHVNLKLFAQWDPDVARGKDRLYEEFVRITNGGSQPISLNGWNLRMGGVRTLRVPRGDPIGAGETLTIHVGSGTNGRYHRFLNRRQPLLKNNSIDAPNNPHKGDGVYLLDPHGDLRAHTTWTCVLACDDPTGGDLRIVDVVWDPDGWGEDELRGEVIRIKNTSASRTIDTGNLVFEVRPYVYELPPKHRLGPGETLEIRMRSGKDAPNVRHLGATAAYLNNDGDRVLVRTYDGIVIDCGYWGGTACPPGSHHSTSFD